MQVEKGGSWKGSSRFFFLFLLLRLGRTVDGRRTFYRSGLEKELSLWRDEEENSYLYLLVRCSLQLLAEPDARNYGGAKTFEMLCGALPFLLEMRFLLSRGGETLATLDVVRSSLSLSPLSFHSSLIPLSVAPTRLATEGGPSLSNFSTSRAPPSPNDLSFLSSSSCLPSNPHSCSARGSRRPAHVLPALGFFPFPLNFFFPHFHSLFLVAVCLAATLPLSNQPLPAIISA